MFATTYLSQKCAWFKLQITSNCLIEHKPHFLATNFGSSWSSLNNLYLHLAIWKHWQNGTDFVKKEQNGMNPYSPCTVCINLETITLICQVENALMPLMKIHNLFLTLQIGINVHVLSLQLHFQIPYELEVRNIIYLKGQN